MDAQRRTAIAAAVLLPLGVLVAAAAWLGSEAPRPPSAEVSTNDARLVQAGAPEVVIVGNSKVDYDLDALALQRGMGWGPVAALRVNTSSAPAWYALLEQRVYGAGYRPALVIVYGTLGAMLRTAAKPGPEQEHVLEQLRGRSEVLERKVFEGEGVGFADRARRHAQAARAALTDTLRDVPVDTLLPPPPRPPRPGETAASMSLERVFGRGARVRPGGRALPVRESADPTPEELRERAVPDTLLPDLLALAAAHGSRMVFVRAPLPPDQRRFDERPDDVLAAVRGLLDASGAGWVDLTEVPHPRAHFRDALHLNAEGRVSNTRACVERLQALAPGVGG